MSKNVKKKAVADKETLDVQVPPCPSDNTAVTDAPYDYTQASIVDAILSNNHIVDDEYNRLYGWISKGDIDATLKCILKELVRIRMGGGHV